MDPRCRCEGCCPENPDPTLTEQYRHECEVRHVVNLPSHARRRDYLTLVRRARGEAAAQRLREDAWRLMVTPQEE